MNVHQENSMLREQVRQLTEMIGGTLFEFPRYWKLTRAEQRLLNSLYTGSKGFRRHEALMYAVAHSDWADDALLKVQVCKVRKKLKPFGIEIKTVWGEGYELTPASSEIIKRAITSQDQFSITGQSASA